MKASRVVLRGVRLREEPLTSYVIRNSLGNEIWPIYNAKYSEMRTFYTPCVSVAVSGRPLIKKFKKTMLVCEMVCCSHQSPHLGLYLAPIRLPHKGLYLTPMISQHSDILHQSQRLVIHTNHSVFSYQSYHSFLANDVMHKEWQKQ